MNIEHAREFLTLAQCLNFTEAANDLNMTQPALSKHLAALERELGAKLVDRTRKSIQLTEEGRMFFETCGIIVNQYDKMQRALDEIKAARPLKIGGRFDDADVATLMSMAAMMYRNAHRSSLAFATDTTSSTHSKQGKSIYTSITRTPRGSRSESSPFDRSSPTPSWPSSDRIMGLRTAPALNGRISRTRRS